MKLIQVVVMSCHAYTESGNTPVQIEYGRTGLTQVHSYVLS